MGNALDFVRAHLARIHDPNELKLLFILFSIKGEQEHLIISREEIEKFSIYMSDDPCQEVRLSAAIEVLLINGFMLKAFHHDGSEYYIFGADEIGRILERCREADAIILPAQVKAWGDIEILDLRAQLEDYGESLLEIYDYITLKYGKDNLINIIKNASNNWRWESLLIEAALVKGAQRCLLSPEGWENNDLDIVNRIYTARFGKPSVYINREIMSLWEKCPDISVWRMILNQSIDWTEAKRKLNSYINEHNESESATFKAVLSQYRKRINPYVDPHVNAIIIKLVKEYPDLDKWIYAFNAAARANALNLNYIIAVLKGRGQSGFATKI